MAQRIGIMVDEHGGVTLDSEGDGAAEVDAVVEVRRADGGTVRAAFRRRPGLAKARPVAPSRRSMLIPPAPRLLARKVVG